MASTAPAAAPPPPFLDAPAFCPLTTRIQPYPHLFPATSPSAFPKHLPPVASWPRTSPMEAHPPPPVWLLDAVVMPAFSPTLWSSRHTPLPAYNYNTPLAPPLSVQTQTGLPPTGGFIVVTGALPLPDEEMGIGPPSSPRCLPPPAAPSSPAPAIGSLQLPHGSLTGLRYKPRSTPPSSVNSMVRPTRGGGHVVDDEEMGMTAWRRSASPTLLSPDTGVTATPPCPPSALPSAAAAAAGTATATRAATPAWHRSSSPALPSPGAAATTTPPSSASPGALSSHATAGTATAARAATSMRPRSPSPALVSPATAATPRTPCPTRPLHSPAAAATPTPPWPPSMLPPPAAAGTTTASAWPRSPSPSFLSSAAAATPTSPWPSSVLPSPIAAGTATATRASTPVSVWLPSPSSAFPSPAAAATGTAPWPPTLPPPTSAVPRCGRGRVSHQRPTPPWPPCTPARATGSRPMSFLSLEVTDSHGQGVQDNNDERDDEDDSTEDAELGLTLMARQDTEYHPLRNISNQGGQVAAARRRVGAAGRGGGRGGGEGGDAVGASQPQGEKWYMTPPMVMLGVAGMYLVYHLALTGVSWIISLLPKERQSKIDNWLWALFWVASIPCFIFPYLKQCDRFAQAKASREAARLAAAPNQANEQPQNAARAPAAASSNQANEQGEDGRFRLGKANATALMMWIGGAARISYFVFGNSFPLVGAAHVVAFVVEVIELLFKYFMEGEIAVQLPVI